MIGILTFIFAFLAAVFAASFGAGLAETKSTKSNDTISRGVKIAFALCVIFLLLVAAMQVWAAFQ